MPGSTGSRTSHGPRLRRDALAATWHGRNVSTLTESAAPVTLRPPRNRVSRKAILYWTIRALIGWLFLLAIQIIWLISDGDRTLHLIGLGVTVVVAAAHLIIMPRWRFRVHLWEVTSEAVYTQSGWLNQERRIAPVSRIQTVDTERGPMEQLFGLSNVTVTTASAAGPLKIEGLDHPIAQRLVEELTSEAQANPGDAT
jgi:membrane protein YdbS with pleckstrin-like domain